MNIPKFLKQFGKDMQVKRYSQGTIENYTSQVKCFLHHFQTVVTEPSKINDEQIKDYLLTSVTANHQRHRHSAIKLFYQLTVHQPRKCRFIPYAKTEKKIPVVLQPFQMQKLFNQVGNLKHKSIIALLYGCGLRVGEVLNLKIEDIKTADGSKHIHIRSGKGNKDRFVMLDDKVLELLRSYYRVFRPVEYLFNGQATKGIPLPQYTESSINKFLKMYASRAGIKQSIHAHLLRHGFATDLFDSGEDLCNVQLALGHANIETTMIYTHYSAKRISMIPSPIKAIAL